jgi:hypothetical protein
MSMPGLAPLRAFARRRAPRCSLSVPVRVTVLGSGTSHSIPGRSVDLGEGGIAVVLAGEVHVADQVGMEFLLPDMGLGLQTKAIVRHHSPLRCGFEFTELTRHQQAVMREWARQRLHAKPGAMMTNEVSAQAAGSRASRNEEPAENGARLRRILLLAGVVLALAGLLVWWRWQKGWKELEERIPQPAGRISTPSAPNYSFFVSDVMPWSEVSVET